MEGSTSRWLEFSRLKLVSSLRSWMLEANTHLALAVAAGSSVLTSLGWTCSSPGHTLCRAAASLLEQTLVHERRPCADPDLEVRVRGLEEKDDKKPSEDVLRGFLTELGESKPWIAELALSAAVVLVGAVQRCVGLWWLGPAVPQEARRAVRRRIN